ncbi:unnamed protein product [Cuscuta europaea]|uniref:Uncharacterized protein n=1 Tax=Cuscuta europaea TaxID=41803 RepID=A0A9P0YQ23_CUSEU|nr:unnamed protein product [Cuscuta europaea]
MSSSTGFVNGPRRQISECRKVIILQLLADRRRIQQLTTYINNLRMIYNMSDDHKTAMYHAEQERHNMIDQEQAKETILANQFDLSDAILSDNIALQSFVAEYFPN